MTAHDAVEYRSRIQLTALEIEPVAQILAALQNVFHERPVDLVRDQRLDQVELVHGDELQDLRARLAGGIAGQGMHHLDMLRRPDALGRRELAAQLLLQRDLIGLDKGIEPDAGSAVGERHDRGVAHFGVFPDQIDQHGRVVDQPAAAAFAIGEIEQAAGDGLVDLLAGHQPDAGDKRFARQNLALHRRQRRRLRSCACASADAADPHRPRSGTAGCGS